MNVIDKIINEVSLDSRVEDGCFNIYNNLHMEAMRDYLIKKDIPVEMVNEFSNTILEKGKHPEKQAWNKDGLLITFPSPEYKQRAIERGTHFEKNPKVTQSNLFGGGQQAPQTANTTPTPDATETPPAPPIPSGDDTQTSPTTPPTQQQPPAVAQTPAQGPLAVEPTTTPIAPQSPPPTPEIKKTPEQIEAEKKLVKNLFNTDDTLPTVPGVGGIGITEDLKTAIKLLVKYI